MKATKTGINYDIPITTEGGHKRTALDIKIRDYVLDKYNGLPDRELRCILHPYFQSCMREGISWERGKEKRKK